MYPPSLCNWNTAKVTTRDSGVSLVIPVRNEKTTVEALVQSIQCQTRLPDEVVLVDGGSTDGTVAWLRELATRDHRFRLIQAGEATPGQGRNIGIRSARYDWIALTDAGLQLDTDWLERLIAARNPARTQVVFGSYEPVVSTFFERCAALAYVPPMKEREGHLMRGPSTASMLIRRGAWEKAGGFPDFRAAEDLIFFERLRAVGAVEAWAPLARVQWNLQPTITRTFSRFVTYSKHNVWAGRQWDWHYGIARQYALAFPFWVLSVLASPLWAIIPTLGLASRALRGILLRRQGRRLLWALNPLQWATVSTILLAIDVATFAGWAQAALHRPPSAESNA